MTVTPEELAAAARQLEGIEPIPWRRLSIPVIGEWDENGIVARFRTVDFEARKWCDADGQISWRWMHTGTVSEPA